MRVRVTFTDDIWYETYTTDETLSSDIQQIIDSYNKEVELVTII
jgi:hypothetical protein